MLLECGCDRTLEVGAATLFVGEDVDDRERGRAGLECEPGDGLRLILDEPQRPAKKRRRGLFLAGLRFEADDESFADHYCLLLPRRVPPEARSRR